jgi:tRNA A37 threonylcarbamoyladenosine dehydratase
LFGAAALPRLAAARLCVVGVGGVGSWAVEALARSGVGHLTLIDMDHVAESNINRQLPALDSTLGRPKVAVLAERIRDINPECRVTLVDDFVTPDNLDRLLLAEFGFVLDCIDNFRTKAALIAHCRRRRQPVITAGGAGGRIDPTRVRVSDLSRTAQDPLLARTRKALRQHYGFPTNPRRRFEVAAAWSDEPLCQGDAGCDTGTGGLSCAGFGSLMPVTAAIGLAMAGQVLRKLAAERRGA